MSQQNNIQSLTDQGLVLAYWAFWFVIFFLAAQQASYLAMGYPRWDFSIVAGFVGIGLMHVLKTQRRDQDTGADNRQVALIRTLTLRAGMPTIPLHSERDREADPAIMAIISSTVGIGGFNRPAAVYHEVERALNLAMPLELVDHAERWRELHRIDLIIVSIGDRVGNADRGLLHDMRLVILKEVFRSGERGVSDAATLKALMEKAPRLSPIYRLLQAISAEMNGESSAGIRIGTWDIVRSWLAEDDVREFDDLLGGDGWPLPPMPKVLQDALKPQPPGKIYTS